MLDWCSVLEYVICYLYYGGNSCIAAVVYRAYEDVVLLFFSVIMFVQFVDGCMQ